MRLVANMRIAPSKAAVASFKGLGLTMISIKVKTKMQIVSTMESGSPRTEESLSWGERPLPPFLYHYVRSISWQFWMSSPWSSS